MNKNTAAARARFQRDGFLITRLGHYRYLVHAGESLQVIAEVSVNRATDRSQDYKVTMAHNGDIIFPFSSVSRAAESAVRHMPHVPDYQI